MERMYKDILTKICENERDLLQTQLSFARIDPPAFAYARTKEPRYTAVLLGEVAYLVNAYQPKYKYEKQQFVTMNHTCRVQKRIYVHDSTKPFITTTRLNSGM